MPVCNRIESTYPLFEVSQQPINVNVTSFRFHIGRSAVFGQSGRHDSPRSKFECAPRCANANRLAADKPSLFVYV